MFCNGHSFFSACSDGEWKCNGEKCELVECNEDEYLCEIDDKCIPLTFYCDFMEDCTDGADENNCSKCMIDDLDCYCKIHVEPISWLKAWLKDKCFYHHVYHTIMISITNHKCSNTLFLYTCTL